MVTYKEVFDKFNDTFLKNKKSIFTDEEVLTESNLSLIHI